MQRSGFESWLADRDVRLKVVQNADAGATRLGRWLHGPGKLDLISEISRPACEYRTSPEPYLCRSTISPKSKLHPTVALTNVHPFLSPRFPSPVATIRSHLPWLLPSSRLAHSPSRMSQASAASALLVSLLPLVRLHEVGEEGYGRADQDDERDGHRPRNGVW